MIPTAASQKQCIAFFAHERGDARVVKRISALGDQGWQVIGFTFHREREKKDVPPTWENIHLGTTYNRRYVQRLWAFVACVGVLWRARSRLAECSALYVVNTDNALLALLGRCFAGTRAPLILELADVQPAMVGNGAVSRLFRAIERFVLDRCALLVTTSPGFVREYFLPIQNYRGDIHLLENKVYPSGLLPETEGNHEPVKNGAPWVVGCFGAFRCRRSLELMRELARKLEGRVVFVLRGYPAGTLADDFHRLMDGCIGIEFLGPYTYPDDLAKIYAAIDFNWAFDESDPNGNSAWLLPNRIYEGGCFGIPALASAATETGRWIASRRAGWTFDEPLEESLTEFFEVVSRKEWMEMRNNCGTQPRTDFTGEGDYARLSDIIREMAAGA